MLTGAAEQEPFSCSYGRHLVDGRDFSPARHRRLALGMAGLWRLSDSRCSSLLSARRFPWARTPQPDYCSPGRLRHLPRDPPMPPPRPHRSRTVRRVRWTHSRRPHSDPQRRPYRSRLDPLHCSRLRQMQMQAFTQSRLVVMNLCRLSKCVNPGVSGGSGHAGAVEWASDVAARFSSTRCPGLSQLFGPSPIRAGLSGERCNEVRPDTPSVSVWRDGAGHVRHHRSRDGGLDYAHSGR